VHITVLGAQTCRAIGERPEAEAMFPEHTMFGRDAPREYSQVGVVDAVRVALVAGATRGAGRAIAVELGRAGFYVHATGRSSRTAGPSEIDRPETIEETGELIVAAGGAGNARVVDHEDPTSVVALVADIEREQGRLDLLVNDIFGGDRYMEWDKPLWEHDWAGGLRMLEMGVHTHLITCSAAIPLMLRTAESHGNQELVVEMTDGTAEANTEFRRNVGFYYDLVKANVERIVKGLSAELENSPVTVVGVTPGWLRSEKMLENFGVSEANWRDALTKRPGFGISESPTYVARGVAALAGDADVERWAGTIISARQLADAYGITDTDGSRPDCWGHIAAYGWEHDDGRGIAEFR
jgi:NAD(P)-dependent dehydrogenase (short-subunit alcohol dehydrogenase family)